MTSRERVLAALRRQDVDHVPCCCFFSPSLAGPRYTWEGRADSLERIVRELGLDGLVAVGLEASVHPSVTWRTWTESVPGEPWPVLRKEIATPAGPLTAAVRRTDDWPHGDDIPLNSDWNVSRFVKPWIETMADVERYRYVQLPPSAADIGAARERFAASQRLADQYQAITYASCGMGLTAGIQLFGAEPGVALSMDRPDIVERFLAVEHEATMGRAAALAHMGVDVICRNGFYETMDFWSPRQVRAFLDPLIRAEIEVMKSGGAVVTYTVCTGIMPMLDLL
ncbi:MAG: hypothetical protein ABIL09_07100, partial [Gemmatimonadota bacterium]